MRVFIAVELPEKVRKEIDYLQHRMRATTNRIKWVDSSAIHITLKFLGEIEEKKLTSVYQATGDTVRGAKTFLLGLEGVGVFPENGDPRVIWIGIGEGSREISKMAAQLEKKLCSQGFAREQRKWVPHITLGRVKLLKDRETLMNLITEHRHVSGGTVQVREVTVMQSRLTPGGARYNPLQRFSLEGQ